MLHSNAGLVDVPMLGLEVVRTNRLVNGVLKKCMIAEVF